MVNNYYWEFIKEADKLVCKFIKESKKIDPNIFLFDGLNLEKPICNFLWQKLFYSKEKFTYSDKRLRRENYKTVIEQIWEMYLEFLLPGNIDLSRSIPEQLKFGHTNSLKAYRNSIIFYCFNKRQLNYYLPLLRSIKFPVIILSSDIIDESLFENNPYVRIIEYEIQFMDELIRNDYLKEKFPYIFKLLNSLTIVLFNLRPKLVVMLEGCHVDEEIISAICKKIGAKTICIQQGWPSIMHTRFIGMTYDYFLTWGAGFSNLWSEYNSIPVFNEVGYFYDLSVRKKEHGITFFFQYPSFIIDENIQNQFIEFLQFCAQEFPERKIFVREHPDYSLSIQILEKLKMYENVILVSELLLSDVFAMTEICVSIFSSTLVEGILHNSIPFVFNVDSNFCYYPNLVEDGIGIEVTSLNKAKKVIKALLEDKLLQKKLISRLEEKKCYYFKCHGTSAVKRALKFISNSASLTISKKYNA